MAMKLSDYVITEAGFGADLGAEKFLNIKARKNNLEPSVVILVATIKAIKYHGGVEKEKIQEENLEAIEKGLANVYRHIDNLKNKFGQKVIVALNKYSQDIEKEIQFIEEKLQERNIEMSLVEGWEKGSEGAKDIANKIVQVAEEKPEAKLQLTYEDEDSIKEKIEKIATKIYGAKEVEYTDIANSNIEQIEKLGYGNLPICIAKTQYSFSDDAKNLECNGEYNIHVQDVDLKAGAGFIVVLAGKIMTMPGLPKKPAAEQIDIDESGEIKGLF